MKKLREYKTVAGLLGNRDRWCKGTMARISYRGQPCEVEDGKAFCLYGAIERVYKPNGKIFEIVSKMREVLGREIVAFNDDCRTTYEKVIMAVKKAKI